MGGSRYVARGDRGSRKSAGARKPAGSRKSAGASKPAGSRKRSSAGARSRPGVDAGERKRTRPIARRVAKTLVVLAMTWMLATAGAVALLRHVNPPVTAMMLQQPMPLAAQAHAWVARDAIAAAAAYAVIASEDQRFLAHNGFDFASIEKAVAEYRAGGELRGASTITQQVAKNLFLWPGRSFVRKGIEAYFTLLIEALWPKERILEVYLNVAELGDGVFGVEAAALEFFGTGASELGDEQAALLAAVLPSPKRLRVDRPSGYVEERRAWILAQMRSLRADGHFRELDW